MHKKVKFSSKPNNLLPVFLKWIPIDCPFERYRLAQATVPVIADALTNRKVETGMAREVAASCQILEICTRLSYCLSKIHATIFF